VNNIPSFSSYFLFTPFSLGRRAGDEGILLKRRAGDEAILLKARSRG
jgi:hypothetical protein